MKNKLFDYLETFMLTNEWLCGNTPKQARAIFTTLCFVGWIDADTAECDNILHTLYTDTSMENIMEYEEFESFMIELIV